MICALKVSRDLQDRGTQRSHSPMLYQLSYAHRHVISKFTPSEGRCNGIRLFVDFHSAVTNGEGVSDGIILEETGNVFWGTVRLNCEECRGLVCVYNE